jgi:membrane-bound lytic murein transglycosylase D
MAKNPAQYGLSNLTPDPPLVVDTVVVNTATDLRLVSDIVGAPVQEIAAINPALLRMSTPPDTPYELHLPAGTKDLFTRTIAEIPENKRATWRYHKLQPGETLEDVAHQYHLTAADIAFVNQIQPDQDLTAANSQIDALIIPVAPAVTTARSNTRYRVQRGDTLVTVADRFDVTPEQLRRWNHLRVNHVVTGQSLYVAEPAHIATRKKSRGTAAAKAQSGKSGKKPLSKQAAKTTHASSKKKLQARSQ